MLRFPCPRAPLETGERAQRGESWVIAIEVLLVKTNWFATMNRSSPPAISPFPLVEPTLRDRDLQTSIGLQDEARIQDTTYATTSPPVPGFGAFQAAFYFFNHG